MTDRKKPGVAFWATVAVVVVLVGYPLGYGPIAGLHNRELLPRWLDDATQFVYWPINYWLYLHGPKPVADAILWWANFWTY
jgi:hypothetical protein